MTTIATTFETISEVYKHPNADTLDIARLAALPEWSFVTLHKQFKVGDKALYIQIDSVLPDDLIAKIGLTGKLAGSLKNRVKTVELRGQISQGICVNPEAVFTDIPMPVDTSDGVDVSALLNIVKYDPPLKPCQNGMLVPFPPMIHHYDIQGTERFNDVVDFMMDLPCFVTEKVEGSHIAIQRTVDGHLNVCMRNNMIVPDGINENMYYRGMRLAGVPETLESFSKLHPGKTVTLRGELTGPGVEDNIYKFKEFDVYAFELIVEQTSIDKSIFESFMATTKTKVSPIECSGKTLREYLNGRTIPEASNGYSMLNPAVRREGIVIQTLKQTMHPTFGRVILKKHSPLYLAKKK